MRLSRTRRTRPSPAVEGPAGDAGFSLVEVVVALGLFSVLSTAVLGTLFSTITLVKDDKSRLEAVNLASRELEIARDTFTSAVRGDLEVSEPIAENRVENPNPLPGGDAVGEPLVIDNIPYTVVRTARWSQVGSPTGSACDDGTGEELAYLHVEVAVSWPALGDRPPVTVDTVMTPSKGTYRITEGHIGLRVLDRTGSPLAGVEVTATGPETVAGATADDGCVLLSFLTPGSYTVTASRHDHVDLDGDPSGTMTAAVVAGKVWRGQLDYDRGAAVTATLTTATGHALPTPLDLPLTLANSGLVPTGTKVVAGTGTTRSLVGLWPYESGYEIWAGRCRANDPADSEGGARAPAVVTDAGGLTAVAVPLEPLKVTGPAGSSLVATQVADAGCPSGATVRLGRIPAGGVLATSLPYGAWSLTAGTRRGTVDLLSTRLPSEPVPAVTLS